jgi:tetratricopeptide (TPR) repeat protein
LKKHVGAEPEAETSALAASLRPRDENENSRAISAPLHVPQPPASSHSDRPSVAVLPFQNLSGDKEQDYFVDGIVEDIITKLAQFRHLFVIACQSRTESLDAYDYYLRGLAIHDRTPVSRETIDAALQLFMKAIERDPAFAVAYARAARCYASRKSHRWMADPAKETAEATGLARRAIELGRDDAIALSSGGYVLGYVGGDLDESALCIERALALNANLAVAWGYSASIEACLGEPEKAIERAALAMRLSPRDPRLFAWEFNTALACFCAGRHMDAVGWARRALRSQPNYASAIRVTAASYALEGQILQANEMMARLRQLDPTLRLSNLSDVLPPFRRPGDRANYIEGLRRAGLPE